MRHHDSQGLQPTYLNPRHFLSYLVPCSDDDGNDTSRKDGVFLSVIVAAGSLAQFCRLIRREKWVQE